VLLRDINLYQRGLEIYGESLGVYGFYLAGFLAPLAILTALVADFVEASGVIQRPTYQKIIGFGLGFLAYRGFIVSRLIYILDIGSTGVAVIALNFIWLGGILGYINRSFKQWKTLESAEALGRFSGQHLRSLSAQADTWTTWEDVRTSFNSNDFLGSLELVLGDLDARAWKARALAKQGSVSIFREAFKRALGETQK
jgi:hypothetical protein